ncbi:MAG: hypothetical protein KBD37_04595 [Burkholderiales bacterium]|nr:hypothetical protein [Burkholderiales bacterium]
MDINKLLFTGVAIDRIMEFMKHPAHLKDSKNGKYLCTNKINLDFFNLKSPNQLIGHTLKDIDTFMNPYWGAKFANDVEELEYNALHKKERVIGGKHTILLPSGKIIIQQMEKMPIIDGNGKTSSILTVSRQDLTNELSLFELYQLYKKYYSCKRQVIGKFLQHIGLDKHFTQQPTEGELRVLLARRIYSSHKDVGNALNLASKTVEMYASQLADKIPNHNLSMIITLIRDLRVY